MEKLPNHIAIIPDGNRRWARDHGRKPWEGHEAGAQNLEKLVRFALKKGVKCLSFWGSSLDNLKKRPFSEKRALLDIYRRYFKRLMESREIYAEEARINVIGRWEEQFPLSLKKIIQEGIDRTRRFKRRFLNFMLAYDGIDDSIQAIENINRKIKTGKKITFELVKENLMTRDLPPVDYLIRTGGEPHLSAGFMMWDVADAQLYFSEKFFPDFDEKEFSKALEEYSRRQRRFGR